jgi:serine protease Do
VVNNSPAKSGGILVGDVIVKVSQKNIRNTSDLMQAIEEARVGESLEISVWRNREIRKLYVKIKERPDN